MRGKSTVLAGTFRYAYDSTTGGFTRPANPPGETTDATGNRATAREEKLRSLKENSKNWRFAIDLGIKGWNNSQRVVGETPNRTEEVGS